MLLFYALPDLSKLFSQPSCHLVHVLVNIEMLDFAYVVCLWPYNSY